jgi:RimJ/RimL family protein N-acetyltransferase
MDFQRRAERIVTDSVDLDLSIVPWDSEIFGFPVAQIERIVINRDGDHADAMRRLHSWFARKDVRLASCRLASDNLHESMLLEAHGFRFVEMVYRPTLSPIPLIECGSDDLVIAEAAMQDLPAIEAIAAGAFATSRFLIDWRLDPNVSNRRYRTWVRNSFEGGQQRVLKATVLGAIVGFFVIEHRADRSTYWHLTAIAPGWQGKGLGKRLWSAMVARHCAEGVERIETTISAHNVTVMNIYARLGFRFRAPQMTFHWVRE